MFSKYNETAFQFKSVTVQLNETDLESALQLRQWEHAFLICSQLGNKEAWHSAGQGAIRCLETQVRYFIIGPHLKAVNFFSFSVCFFVMMLFMIKL